MDLDSRTALTYRYERWRAAAHGVLETAGTTFLLLIAVRWFQAGATAKALVAGGGSLGFLCSPMFVAWVANRGIPTARAVQGLAFFGALCFGGMAAIPFQAVFVAGSILAMTASSAAVPLLTQIYQENYPARMRGKLFSRSVIIRIGAAALFSELAGRALSGNVGSYRYLLLVFAAAFLVSAYCLGRYPSQALTATGGRHPFRALRFLRQDEVFRRTLICWMLMGFANLMMLPMRVEYLANPEYGLGLSVSEIAFLTGVVPSLGRLGVVPLWGYLFDRMNFFVLRITLNIGFAIGIFAFFFSDSLTGLVMGAVVFGISNGGGDVAWSLWVTKFAPPDQVADYMSVHTFFTGVRGLLAPLAAFHLVRELSMGGLGALAGGLIAVSSLLLVPEVKFDKGRRSSEPLIEEVLD